MRFTSLAPLALLLFFAQVPNAEGAERIEIDRRFTICKADDDCKIVLTDCSHAATACASINHKFTEKIAKPDCASYRGEAGNYECLDDLSLCKRGRCEKYTVFGKNLSASECDRLKKLGSDSNVLKRCKL